ncbi:MAG: hypothetical protein OXG19_07050 [Chloroflexi bacterium]|nr:hypothetical protein [Chloroflexota bacterium]
MRPLWLLLPAILLITAACAADAAPPRDPPPPGHALQRPAADLIAGPWEYQGRVLIVKGSVAAFGRDADGQLYVMLNDAVRGVRCTFTPGFEHDWDATALRATITVVGIGDSIDTPYVPLRRCRPVN